MKLVEQKLYISIVEKLIYEIFFQLINGLLYGKISYFQNRYQMTNPDYVTTLDKENYVKQVIPKYF